MKKKHRQPTQGWRCFLVWANTIPITMMGFGFASNGDPAGARTPDNRLKRQVLYQLSYRVI